MPVPRGRVAVTPRSLSGGHTSLDRLVEAGLELVFPSPGRTPSHEDLLAALPGCIGYLAGVERVGADLIAASPELRVIARNGVGVDNVDLSAAEEAGIEVRPAECVQRASAHAVDAILEVLALQPLARAPRR